MSDKPTVRNDLPKGDVVTKTRTKTQRPSLYKVLLLNDDYTPMEFVIHVLERFFAKNREDATRIMLHVHQNGVGICGVFTFEVAETKVDPGGRVRAPAPASVAVHHGEGVTRAARAD